VYFLVNIQSRDSILEFLKKRGLSDFKIKHSITVANLALKIADEIMKDEIKINKQIVEVAGLLHDVGLSIFGEIDFEKEMANPAPEHCVSGAKIVLEAGYPRIIAECIECHELWSGDEAREIGFPEPIKEDYFPKTWEAKALAYADLVVFVYALGYDILDDPEVVIKASYLYRNECFKKVTGKCIEKDHAIIKRVDKFNSEMIKYFKREFIPNP